jgi:tripartite-type tricarboxylate transporter receptor subunit TctC
MPKVGEKLGTSIVVENQPGAAMMIAMSAVARPRPMGTAPGRGDCADGVNQTLYKPISYDPDKVSSPSRFMRNRCSC